MTRSHQNGYLGEHLRPIRFVMGRMGRSPRPLAVEFGASRAYRELDLGEGVSAMIEVELGHVFERGSLRDRRQLSQLRTKDFLGAHILIS